jgi:hypothetical protein
MNRKFETKLEADDRGHVRLPVPFDPSEAWGKKPRHFIQGTINGSPIQGSLGSRSGRFFFPVAKDLREKLGLAAGAVVKVCLSPGTAEENEIPEDLAVLLAKDKKALEFFDGLSAFYRNTFVKKIVEAKKPETRAERVKKICAALKAGKKQI